MWFALPFTLTRLPSGRFSVCISTTPLFVN
jgi:hypothetical protein